MYNHIDYDISSDPLILYTTHLAVGPALPDVSSYPEPVGCDLFHTERAMCEPSLSMTSFSRTRQLNTCSERRHAM